jgi:hypothetical protein
MISSTPRKPSPIASQRLAPTRSAMKIAASMAMISGEVMTIAVAFTSGRWKRASR